MNSLIGKKHKNSVKYKLSRVVGMMYRANNILQTASLFTLYYSLYFTIYAKLLPSSEAPIQGQIQTPCPAWNAAFPQDLHNYHTQADLLISATDVPHEVLRCTNPNCNDEAHRTLLSKLYNDIIKSLKDAAEAIPTKANNTSSKYTVLGWNNLVSDSHQAGREFFSYGGLLGVLAMVPCMI